MFKKAFTMAELLAVMIVIGVLATALMQNFRSPKVKEKELIANALKAIEVVEQAFAKVKEIDKINCPTGTFISKQIGTGTYAYELRNDEGTSSASATDVVNLLGKYIRYEGGIVNFCSYTSYCTDTSIKGAKLAGTNIYIGFKVNTGIEDCPTYKMPNDSTTYPAPTQYDKKAADFVTTKCWGELYIDTNNIDSPNTYGQDVFKFGLGEHGIAK
ncbi:type II secretion system protein [bacterium]|nr:type II secretion system protein [bacterium]